MEKAPNFLDGRMTFKKERLAQARFAHDKFPTYEPYWDLFVASRTKLSWRNAVMPSVPSEERRIIKLAHSIFHQLYKLNMPIKRDKRDANYEERMHLRTSLNRLHHLLDRFDLLLFALLIVTHGVEDSNPVYQTYVDRIAEHEVKIQAEKITNIDRGSKLGGLPKSSYLVAILPEEQAVLHEAYSLGLYTELAQEVNAYYAAVKVLLSFDMKYWMPRHDQYLDATTWAQIKAEDEALVQADEPALQEIIGKYPSSDALIQDLVDRLTKEINRIWGEGIMPRISQYESAKTSTHTRG